ncbi:MAG: endolytic transglycosylase MltG [Gemmatimonadales bacterium]|nr:endolytic transglycosylase MltG [Gemmatimonadales bacterium]
MRWSAAAGAVLVVGACSNPSGDGNVERVAIPAGSTMRSVADSLEAHELIGSRRWFLLQARLQGVDRAIKPGVYEFLQGTSTGSLLDQLRRGDAVRFRVTLPEGGTIYDLARSAEKHLGIPRDSLLAAARDPALRSRFQISGPSVEGWLLPETFDFGGMVSADQVLARFLEARRAAWDTSWTRRAGVEGLDERSVLTLASIVEAEALDPAERATIAAVYRNRLRIGMALQADPTIQYGYLVAQGARRPRLFNTDYEFASPWNTYLAPGLPPGPIGNPTGEAIEAVLSPAPVPYLYFVADSSGRHRFSTTYAEHLQAIREIRE